MSGHYVGDSPFGRCAISFKGEILLSLAFVNNEEITRLTEDLKSHGSKEDPSNGQLLLSKIFDNPSSVKLSPKGTDFQKKVWHELQKVPEGTTLSYEELAEKVSSKSAVRAVASAVAKNPIAWLIPCHRVIKKDGSIHNYRWGKEKKIELLKSEGTIKQDVQH